MGELAEALRSALGGVVVCPRRLSLETPGVRATVPMVRGVWGAALRGLDMSAYKAVFEGLGPSSARTPGYVLRSAAVDASDAPAVEWLLYGGALAYDAVLLRAWDVASGMGLGPRRVRFGLRGVCPLGPGGERLAPSRGGLAWGLDQAAGAWGDAGGAMPCRLRFRVPLRLMRGGRLNERPSLADVVVGLLRRLAALGGRVPGALQEACLACAGATTTGVWEGERLDLVRYSGRQRREVELRGVAGHLDLPRGAGPLWPLLSAGLWMHLGKGTAVGMGQLALEPLEAR
jgi:hypothetical protein